MAETDVAPAPDAASGQPADAPRVDVAGPNPAPAPLSVAHDEGVVVVAPRPADALPPTDPHSEDYRFQIGAHPETAAADLDRALTVGAGHPLPYPQAAAERARAEDERRLNLGRAPATADEVADHLFPADTDENRASLVRANAERLDDPIMGVWIEHAQVPTIKYRVQKNTGDQPIEFTYANGQTAICAPGDYFGVDAAGDRIVLTAATVHGEYRAAVYTPTAQRIL